MSVDRHRITKEKTNINVAPLVTLLNIVVLTYIDSFHVRISHVKHLHISGTESLQLDVHSEILNLSRT
jgi:hypothetical protein